MTSRRFVVLAVLLVGLAAPSRPAAASQTTELGAQMTRAGGLIRTESLIVARLTRRVTGSHFAYVTFETERVLRGEPQGRLLFTHPERDRDSMIDFHSITDEEIDQLTEGGRFLVWVGRGVPPALVRWKPLPPDGELDEAALAAELEPYKKLDRNLALDPWTAASHPDIYVRGCVNSYYYSSATPEQLRARLTEFAAFPRQTAEQDEFVRTLLRRVSHRQDAPGELLVRVYWSLGGREGPAEWRARVLRRELVELLAERQGAAYEDVILDALRSSHDYVRGQALAVLAKRRVPASDGLLDASWLRREGERDSAAKALVRQRREEAVKHVLALVIESPGLIDDSYTLFTILAEHVGAEHGDAIRQLDDPASRPRHARVTQLLVAAKDPAARAELARLAESGAMERLPWHGDGWVLREAEAFRPLARRVLREGLVDGSNFICAVHILRHLRDPELHALLKGATAHPWFHRWALEFLHELARPEDRDLFRRFLAPAHARHDACRVYALAGLARLGDEDAAAALVEAAWLAPLETTRYYATDYALATLEPDFLLRAWMSRQGDCPLGPAAREHVAARLKEWAATRPAGAGAPGTAD